MASLVRYVSSYAVEHFAAEERPEMLVVEEKLPFLETALKDALYGTPLSSACRGWYRSSCRWRATSRKRRAP